MLDQADDDATGEGGGGAGFDDADKAQMSARRSEGPVRPATGARRATRLLARVLGQVVAEHEEIYLELYVDADTPAEKVRGWGHSG